MENNRFTYCPSCGSKNIQTLLDGRKWQCPDCTFTLFNNVASAVGILIRNEKGEVLFERRAKEPKKGYLTIPGGFCEPDESGEAAAVRECEEEIGVRPADIRYLCSCPNTYPYKDVLYKTCDMYYTAVLPQGYELKAQQSEVTAFEWIKVSSKEDVEQLPIAFDSLKKMFLFWLEAR